MRCSFTKNRIAAAAAVLSVLTSVSAFADRLDDMISPMSHAVNFEDPRQSTELRPLYVYHQIDDQFVTGGGNAQVYALQARFKVSDDFSIIATKDGYVDLNTKAVVPQKSGFANVALGGKYSFYQTSDSIISGGLRYEIPMGQHEVLQGHGEGIINPFVSAAVAIGDLNLMAGSGFRLRFDSSDSSFYDLDLHASYKIGDFYPLVEMGLVHVLAAGDRLPIADEGEDFFNLGSSESAGKNIVTAAFGGRYRINKDVDVGVAYEIPVNRGNGSRILDYRVSADLIYKFSI